MYFTPFSIGFLTQLVLAIGVASYFLYAFRKSRSLGRGTQSTKLLAGAFTSFAYTTLFLFLNDSLRPDQALFVVPLESVAMALFLVLLLQFAYHFPAPLPGRRWEARIVLGISLLYASWEAAFALHRYRLLAEGLVRFRPAAADYPLLLIFLWIALVLLRQSSQTASMAGLPGRPRSLEERANACRILALLSLTALALGVVNLLKERGLLPATSLVEMLHSLGVLLILALFALICLNHLPGTTSFLVRLVGISLTVMLAIVGSIGWIIAPPYLALYTNEHFLAGGQTLRFAPNAQGGYDVTAIPFHFQDDLGRRSSAQDERVQLAFDFPFYGQIQREAVVLDDGGIIFGAAAHRNDVRLDYGPQPAIFAMFVDLAQQAGSPGDSGLFLRSSSEALVVTWRDMGKAHEPRSRYTLQAALYPAGVFELAYHTLPASEAYAIQEARHASWLIGATPGASKTAIQHVRFASDLPFSGAGAAAIVEDYYLDFRSYLHRLFLPLAHLTLLSSVLIIGGLPVFLRFNLVKPLNNLLEGVRQVNAGNLEIEMAISYRDEIGFLTQSFNDMARDLQGQTLALQQRAAELGALASVSSALRQAATSQEVIQVLVEAAVEALEGKAGAVLLLEGDQLVIAGLHGHAGQTSSASGDAFPSEAIARPAEPGQRMAASEILCWQKLQAGQWVQSDLDSQGLCSACILCRSLALDGQPLLVAPLQASGQILGVLQVVLDHPDRFSAERRRTVVAIAEMGGNALERAKTMELLEELIANRTRELSALYAVTNITTQYLDLQAVLERVLQQALETMGCAAGCIHLLDSLAGPLRLAAHWGASPELLAQLQDEQSTAHPWGQVRERQETLVMASWPAGAIPDGSFAGTPLQTSGRAFGVFSVFTAAGRQFSVEDIVLLRGIAEHIAAAVERAQLRRRAQEAAVLEERQRLARELHDSVSQSLHSLILSADTARHLLEQERIGLLRASLNRLAESARQSLKEMRLLLYGLRLAPLDRMNLVDALALRLQAVEQRAGIDARLEVEPAAAADTAWPALLEEELYWIATEALNNALHHARATEVVVRLSRSANQVELAIADNGRGFDSSAAQAGGLGLLGMTERARRLASELVVESASGQGTRVVVRIGTK